MCRDDKLPSPPLLGFSEHFHSDTYVRRALSLSLISRCSLGEWRFSWAPSICCLENDYGCGWRRVRFNIADHRRREEICWLGGHQGAYLVVDELGSF
ncbi:hypothetical protein CC78DRAFT_534728 [Lojkania enalia]|uniref:Uncharacterized protein n=1 Tax=Lojkania enalia TaxID=147567 RepID=A0A9P4K4N3_9PLEO|nr:hypothetical protein CC78DRAFT_534728 [Didymosphaeria enalia]